MTGTDSLNIYAHVAEITDELGKLTAELEKQSGLPPQLFHLVLLRASQINGCAFCIRMHTRDSRAVGVADERLDRLVGWRHMEDYSDAERAAFAWTEALTDLDPSADHAPYRAELRRHLSEKQVAHLTVAIGMINMWNRVQAADH